MVAFDNRMRARRVVAERAGVGTGDTVYIDEFGTAWVSDHGGKDRSDETAAPMQAILTDGIILARAVAEKFADQELKHEPERPRVGKYGPQWGFRK